MKGWAKNALRWLAGAVLYTSWVGSSLAAAIIVTPVPGGNVKVKASYSGLMIATISTLHPFRYKICFKENGTNQQACYRYFLTNDAPALSIYPLTAGGVFQDIFYDGQGYTATVFCMCKAHPLLPYSWKEVGSAPFVYKSPPFQSFRVRSVATGQCAYVDPNGSLVRHWTCWSAQGMIFSLSQDPASGAYYLRNSVSGLCVTSPLIGSNNVIGVSCGSALTLIDVVNIGGGQVRLRHILTNRCLFAQSSDGEQMQREPCNTQPKFAFVLDPV